jgi:hypothetical protein
VHQWKYGEGEGEKEVEKRRKMKGEREGEEETSPLQFCSASTTGHMVCSN